MLKVSALIKYLNENNQASSPLRPVELTFLNYLSHHHEPLSLVSSDTLDGFFRHCLVYPHWQQNRAQLGQEIRDLFQGSLTEEALIDDLNQVKWPEKTQVLEIENKEDLTDILQTYLNSIYKKGEKYRLVVDGEKIFALILRPDFGLTVQFFDKKMMIRHGHLEPLRVDLCLHYTKNLELDSEKLQKIEVAPYSIAQFYANDDAVTGSLTRGYTLQKTFEFKDSPMESFPKLFYTLKRAEQHFLSRESDPFYQQTIASLESSIQALKESQVDAAQMATDTMAKTQNALEFVFTGDRVLGLLLRDLQHTLALRHRTVATTARKAEAARKSPWNQPKEQSGSISLSPTVESPAVELLID